MLLDTLMSQVWKAEAEPKRVALLNKITTTRT